MDGISAQVDPSQAAPGPNKADNNEGQHDEEDSQADINIAVVGKDSFGGQILTEVLTHHTQIVETPDRHGGDNPGLKNIPDCSAAGINSVERDGEPETERKE